MINIMKLRVAYAKSRYKGKVYQTPLVVTSYRDEHGTARNKTLVSLAKMPAFLVELIDQALKLGDTSVLEKYVSLEELQYLHAVVLGPVWVVWSVLQQLGIFAWLRASLSFPQAVAVLMIVVERVIAARPRSVMALQRRFAAEPLAYLLHSGKAPALKTCYGALAKLEEKREFILRELYRRNPPPGQLFLYDITSSYFEGETCPLAEYGYNRDGKSGKKQVVIGVICGENGCPLWVDVFKGNTSDQTTVKQQLQNLQTKLGVKEFVFVGDRGMVTSARIAELEKEGWWESFQYITALTRQEMMRLVEREDHPVQLELFDHQNLVEVEKDGTRYVLCHSPFRMDRDRETRRRLLELTEAKLRSLEKQVASGRWKRKEVMARYLYRWINRWGMERFFAVEYGEGQFTYRRREDEIERYARLDGCYVIRSNVNEKHLTSEELRDHYKDLKHVEQAFRTMKTTDIQTRPIRHFREAHVKGHIFACFLAYRVIWELRQRWEPVLRRDAKTQRCEAGSLADIWRELDSVSLAKLEAKGKIIYKLSPLSPAAQKLLTLGKIPSLQERLPAPPSE